MSRLDEHGRLDWQMPSIDDSPLARVSRGHPASFRAISGRPSTRIRLPLAPSRPAVADGLRLPTVRVLAAGNRQMMWRVMIPFRHQPGETKPTDTGNGPLV